MLGLRRLVPLLLAAGLVYGQPALTTIQDILYRADGTRFSGTMFIHWQSFLAGDTSNVVTANLTMPIVNGVLNVKLVPTTTASAGAQYNITYASGGVSQFTEVWAVPPSTPRLRVRDVRLSTGTVVGPAPLTSSPIQISDVTGLTNALAVRPTEGVGFSIGRAAVINQAGQIEAATGNLGDCVHVDGSADICGGGGRRGLAPLLGCGISQWHGRRNQRCVYSQLRAFSGRQPDLVPQRPAAEARSRFRAGRQRRHFFQWFDSPVGRPTGGKLSLRESQQSFGHAYRRTGHL